MDNSEEDKTTPKKNMISLEKNIADFLFPSLSITNKDIDEQKKKDEQKKEKENHSQ